MIMMYTFITRSCRCSRPMASGFALKIRFSVPQYECLRLWSGRSHGVTKTNVSLSYATTRLDEHPHNFVYQQKQSHICKFGQQSMLLSRVIITRNSSTFLSHVNINEVEIQEINRRNASEVLEKYDTVLLDCDGVLWGPDHTTHLHGTAEAVKRLQSLGKQVLFVTNNSMHCRKAYVRKFNEYGFDAAPADVFCVAYASAVYLKDVLHVEGSVYLIGSPGMSEELENAKIKHYGLGSDPDHVYDSISDLMHVPLRDDITAVLVGYDKYFDMRKLFKACSYLANPQCLYLATSDVEKSVFISPGRRRPVTGAVVDAVTSAAKRLPQVLGKPDTHLFECIKATHPGVDRSRCLMVGDSVPADIGLAKAVGMDSVLVLTGASSLETVRASRGLEPTYFMQSLAMFCNDGK